jgi:hypothetical protein
MSKQQEIKELYDLLRSADAKAQAGDEKAQADAQGIYDHIQALESKVKEQKEGEFPPVVAAGLGVGAKGAAVVAKKGKELWQMPAKVAQAAEAQTQQSRILSELLKDKKVQESIRGVTQPNADVNWTKSMTGIAPPGSTMSKESLDQAQAMKRAIGPGGDMPGGSIYKDSVIVPPDMRAERAAQAERMLRESSMMGKLGKYGSAVKNVVGPVAGKVMPWMNAATLPFNAAEAYNRGEAEDPIGATISGIGTVAGAASLYPPLTVPAGLISLGASGVNWARDEYLKRKGQPQPAYEEQMAMPYATGGLVYLR